MLANPEREIYEVTGQIEYLQEVVDFLMAHQSIPDEVEEETEGDERQEDLRRHRALVSLTQDAFRLASSLARHIAEVPECGEALSALAWKRGHAEYADLPDPIWLHCVLYEATLARRRIGQVRFERVELPPAHPLSGNIVVRDVMVSRV